MISSDLQLPAEAGFAKAENRLPDFGIMLQRKSSSETSTMRLASVTALLLAGALLGASAAQGVPLPPPRPKRLVAPLTTQSIPPSRPSARSDQTTPQSTAAGAAPLAAKMSQQQLIERVNLYLSRVRTLVGKFTQIGPDGRRSEGDLYIQKPGKLRFAYHAPSVLDVIADGNSLVVRDRREATQQLYPLSQTPLRFLLSSEVDLARDTKLLAVSADKTFVSVVIEESQPFVGTHRLLLMFDVRDFQLRQWTVTDPQGFHTTVAVFDLDSTKRPDPNLFKIDYATYN
jgi:outer membrane lipoprotein-sorting protein